MFFVYQNGRGRIDSGIIKQIELKIEVKLGFYL
jgi:hypothetical protein